MYKYYGRQPYYRNSPLIYKIQWDGKSELLYSGNFHVDRLHQLSIMLLLNDLTERDTHMEYALRSHKKRLRLDHFSDDEKSVQSKYEVAHLTGPKGTLYLFDSGGIHRAHVIPNSARVVLHLNVNPGHHIEPQRYDMNSNWPLYESLPLLRRRLLDRVICRYPGY